MWNFKIFLLVFSIFISFTFGALDDFSSNKFEKLKNFSENKVKSYKSSSKSDEITTYRLPNNSIPLHYDITITTDIHRQLFNFSGSVKIHIKILDYSNQITIHARQINIESINFLHNNQTQYPNYEFIPSHDFLVITLPEYYETNSELTLEITYNGQLRNDGFGFFYKNHEKFFAATQFQVDDARHAFPCYDEPGIRAVMSVTIIHDKSYTATSNMPILEQIDSGNYVVTKFYPTPRMQTYTLAFMVHQFEYIEAVNSRILQRIFSTSEVEFAASIIGPILDKFEELLSANYPLPKLDHVAIPQFAFGGMENFGLINYEAQLILLNPNLKGQAILKQQNVIISIISHEIAHQWFGNIVSPTWWTYTWLNEGFATLFEKIVADLLYPERKFMNTFVTSIMPDAFRDDGPGSWAMNHYTEKPHELWTKFNGIAYKKAACVLRMMMDVMSVDVFMKGLNYYLVNNYMQAVRPADLHEGLQAAYDEKYLNNSLKIEDVMGTWENQAGYPLVSVSIQNNSIILTQRRFPVSDNEIYSIPITIATKSNANFLTNSEASVRVWLHSSSSEYLQSDISFNPNDWIILNIQQIGYYRVDYEASLWRSIIQQLFINNNKIHPINRAVLQDEIYLAWTVLDRVTASDCLDMLSYFDMEDEPMVWSKAQSTLNLFNNRLFGTEAHGSFLLLVKILTNAHLFRIGYEDQEDEDLDIIQLRSLTSHWNCMAMDKDCLIRDYDKFWDYRTANGSDNFNFCNAFRLVDDQTFAELLNETIDDIGVRHRTQILANMGCTLSDVNLDELLKAVLNGDNNLNIFEREMILLNTFSKSRLGLIKSLEFIDEMYKDLNKLLPTFYDTVRQLALFINGDLNTAVFTNIINNLLNEAFITVQNYQTILNTVDSNNKWIERNYKDVMRWFGYPQTK